VHTIPGPRDLPKPISGCPLAPRCEFAQEKCVTSTIARTEIADGHFSACLRIQLKGDRSHSRAFAREGARA